MQAGLRLAQAWGGGLAAAVDGRRFVVPVPAVFARPNRRYFGSRHGMTWLNAMNDRSMGRGAKAMSGTIRDSLHMVDVIFGLDGDLPEIVVSDTGSYSDVVFGLLELLGISYRPALADLPDQKGWRINASADYGPLNTFARGKIDLRKIRRNREDILRVVASIYTGTVRAYDVVTMLQRDGHPTALGEAIASYGRTFKTLHILQFIDVDETYRRDIKDIRNLQENRHSLPRPGRGHGPAVSVRPLPPGRPRHLHLRPARSGPRRHPGPTRSGRRRGRRRDLTRFNGQARALTIPARSCAFRRACGDVSVFAREANRGHVVVAARATGLTGGCSPDSLRNRKEVLVCASKLSPPRSPWRSAVSSR
jgi:TnpA family transposase